jgi:hypothetical protein
MKSTLLTLAVTTALVSVSSAALAASPHRNVPTLPSVAIEHAAAAGINLVNTVASDAGAGNGNEVVVASVVPSVVTSTQTTSDTDIVSGTPVETTDSTVISTDTVWGPWTPVGNSGNFKSTGTTTTVNEVITTTTTPQTQVTTEQTNTIDTPIETTNYDEIDPGKSQAHNQAPEEGAPEPLVVEGEPVITEGTPVVTEVALDPLVEVGDPVETTTVTTLNKICNNPHPC